MTRKILPPWRRYLTVEPVIFFYAYGLMMSMPIWRQYIYSVISEKKGFPYDELLLGQDEPGCPEHFTGPNSTSLKDLEQEVQSLATKIDSGNMFFMAIPSLIVAPFWGPWTDKTRRRKPALIAPTIGASLNTAVVLLVMYFEWPLYALFVGSAISGVSGFLTTVMLATMSYIADTTEKSGIAIRLAIIQMLVFMGGVLSQLTSGLWIQKFGFIAPTWLILACQITSVLGAIFLVPEPHERVTNKDNKFFDLKSLKALVNVFRKKREGGRKTLLLLVCAGAVVTLTTLGLGGVTALFVMRSPLCFGPKLVGYFLAYRMFVSGLGGPFGVKFLRKFFSEMTTSAISVVSQIGEMMLLAFATRTWLVFTAPVLGLFKSTVNPIFTSIMSRIVGADEQGSLFCAYGFMNVFAQFLGVMLFNNVYEGTLGLKFNGFVFIVCAVVKLIPLFLLKCMHVSPVTEPAETKEELKLDDDEENGNELDVKLIQKKFDALENENEKCRNGKVASEAIDSTEDIEFVTCF